MRKALGYVRVSGKSQATDGTGLDEQRAQIEAWAARNGYVIVEWFTDAGVSGELPWHKRPQMNALVERLAVNGIDAVVVHAMDRLSRGGPAILNEFLAVAHAAGVEVISTVAGRLTPDSGADEFQSAGKEMTQGIMALVDQHAKRILVARMKLGRLRAKAAGKHMDGQHFYGTDPRKPEEIAILERMRQLRDSGLTYYSVGKALDTEGLKPRKAAKWSPQAIEKILTRGNQND